MGPLDLSRFYNPHPTLYTERLVLRPLRLSDAEAMFEYHSDPEVTRYVHFGPAQTIDVTKGVIERLIADFERQDGWCFAMALKDTDKLIGTLDVHSASTRHHRCELGWMMTRQYWGSGYMTEAVKEMIRFCFEELGMHRIEATLEEGNVRAERVAERVGMKREGVLRENEVSKGRFVSNIMYAIVQAVQ